MCGFCFVLFLFFVFVFCFLGGSVCFMLVIKFLLNLLINIDIKKHIKLTCGLQVSKLCDCSYFV